MIKLHIRRVLVFLVTFVIVGLAASLVLPKWYEGRAELMVGEDIGTGKLTSGSLRDDVQSIVDGGFGVSPLSDGDVLRSQDLFYEAVRNVARDNNIPALEDQSFNLFRKFDVVQSDGSRTAEVIAQASNPDLAAALANEVAHVYNEQRVKIQNSNYQQAETYLGTQLAAAKQAQSDAEAALSHEQAVTGVRDVTIANTVLGSYQLDLKTRLNAAKSAYEGAIAEVANLEKVNERKPRMASDNAAEQLDPQLKALQDQVTLYKHGLVDDLKIYTDNSPTITEDKDAVKRSEEALKKYDGTGWEKLSKEVHIDLGKQQLELDLADKRANRDSLGKQYLSLLNSQKASDFAALKLPESEKEIVRLKRDVDVAELNYKTIKAELSDIQYREKSGAQASAILFPAKPNSMVINPDPVKYSIAGAVVGICLGLMYSFGIEALKMPVHSATQLSETLGLGVAASVPGLSARKASSVLKGLPSPKFRPAESFRYLAFALLSRGVKESHIVLFTGAGTGSELPASSAEFALSLASAGVNTLLIDADLVKAGITKTFGYQDKSGVSDILEKSMLPGSPSETLGIPTNHLNLSILPSGAKAGRGLGAYPLSDLSGFLELVREQYSVIVISCAPLGLASDATALANYVDDVYLVVSATDSNLRSVASACDVLSRSGAKKLEVVLVNSSPKDEPFSLAEVDRAAAMR